MMHNPMAYMASSGLWGNGLPSVPPPKASLDASPAARSLSPEVGRRYRRRHVSRRGAKHLMKATAILRGLSHNLDFAASGAVAEHLFQTHHNRPDPGEPQGLRPAATTKGFSACIIAAIAELREAWDEVDSTPHAATRPVPAESASPGLKNSGSPVPGWFQRSSGLQSRPLSVDTAGAPTLLSPPKSRFTSFFFFFFFFFFLRQRFVA